jgi:hypothetical protein
MLPSRSLELVAMCVSADTPGQACCHQACCIEAMEMGHGLSIAHLLQVEYGPITPILLTPLRDHISFPWPGMHHLTVCLPCYLSSAQSPVSAMLRGLVVHASSVNAIPDTKS